MIKALTKENALDLVPLFMELEHYYFGKDAASEAEIRDYLSNKVFSQNSGVSVIAFYHGSNVVGFATFTIMYPAPKLSGQMFMKDLFVSSMVRGQGVGIKLMQHIARIAVASGCNRFDWTAESTNPNAGKFYQAIGASVVKEKQYYRLDNELLTRFLNTSSN
ncbi:GNAT family N-acetyltransferase [Vibrio sp. S4M6]|uniref:GNAT family N-acetyltransferase n=1 Tax=Vibrio sinus TaxID=2946865 RepID=UPI00202A8E99|nr:GNAT family N-acetyltransferase [Vibrio sinus]MCL9783246.1 GNAT family N-acetyltransferase [Vibrio sinus]